VDDLAQNVRLLEAVLSPKGFRVAKASSGEEALDVLSKEHPDLVLLDILMPGMDGMRSAAESAKIRGRLSCR
jgi:Response regulator containing CheY-like receiver, AAA-type ATPase, and DNA-binding domains